MTKRPKIVFIDWSGTLSRSKFWGHLENSSEKDRKLFKLIDDNLFRTNSELIKPWMRAELTSEDVNKRISEELEVDFNKVYREFIKSCKLMEFVTPRIPALIKKLRRSGMKVYIASNNMDSFDRWTIPGMKLTKLFDGIINSYAISCFKNDFDSYGKSLFFEKVLAQERAQPQQTVLIDDSEDKGNLISNYGIGYIKISEISTLENNLEKLLE